MTSTQPRALQHSMTRVAIPTGIAFDEFRAAFEEAAPAFDAAQIQQISDSAGTWDDVRAAVTANAPNELMVYAMIDATPDLKKQPRLSTPRKSSRSATAPAPGTTCGPP